MSDNTELMAAHPGAARQEIDNSVLEKLIVQGDVSKLSSAERLMYYRARCDAAGLDYRSQPFEFVSLQGKLTLYARKAATDQLSAIHGARVKIVSRETSDDIHSVIVNVELANGRSTEDIGCVNVKGLSGDNLANAKMKAMTKAKRRAILSLCGLGMVDETELETIPRIGNAARQEPKTLDAVVEASAAIPATPPASPQDEPASDTPQTTYFGIACVGVPPWEEWQGEKIGGANPVLGDRTWEWLLTTDDQAALEQAGKALKGGAAQQEKTGKPPPERYQRLAVVMQMRQALAPKEVPA